MNTKTRFTPRAFSTGGHYVEDRGTGFILLIPTRDRARAMAKTLEANPETVTSYIWRHLDQDLTVEADQLTELLFLSNLPGGIDPNAWKTPKEEGKPSSEKKPRAKALTPEEHQKNIREGLDGALRKEFLTALQTSKSEAIRILLRAGYPTQQAAYAAGVRYQFAYNVASALKEGKKWKPSKSQAEKRAPKAIIFLQEKLTEKKATSQELYDEATAPEDKISHLGSIMAFEAVEKLIQEALSR